MSLPKSSMDIEKEDNDTSSQIFFEQHSYKKQTTPCKASCVESEIQVEVHSQTPISVKSNKQKHIFVEKDKQMQDSIGIKKKRSRLFKNSQLSSNIDELSQSDQTTQQKSQITMEKPYKMDEYENTKKFTENINHQRHNKYSSTENVNDNSSIQCIKGIKANKKSSAQDKAIMLDTDEEEEAFKNRRKNTFISHDQQDIYSQHIFQPLSSYLIKENPKRINEISSEKSRNIEEININKGSSNSNELEEVTKVEKQRINLDLQSKEKAEICDPLHNSHKNDIHSQKSKQIDRKDKNLPNLKGKSREKPALEVTHIQNDEKILIQTFKEKQDKCKQNVDNNIEDDVIEVSSASDGVQIVETVPPPCSIRGASVLNRVFHLNGEFTSIPKEVIQNVVLRNNGKVASNLTSSVTLSLTGSVNPNQKLSRMVKDLKIHTLTELEFIRFLEKTFKLKLKQIIDFYSSPFLFQTNKKIKCNDIVPSIPMKEERGNVNQSLLEKGQLTWNKNDQISEQNKLLQKLQKMTESSLKEIVQDNVQVSLLVENVKTVDDQISDQQIKVIADQNNTSQEKQQKILIQDHIPSVQDESSCLIYKKVVKQDSNTESLELIKNVLSNDDELNKQPENIHSSYQLKQQQSVQTNYNVSVCEQEVKLNNNFIIQENNNSSCQLKKYQQMKINDNLSVNEQEVKINNNLIVHTKQNENGNSFYSLKQQQQVKSNDNLSAYEQEIMNDNLIVHTKQQESRDQPYQLKQEQQVKSNFKLFVHEQEVHTKQNENSNYSFQLKQEQQVNDNLSVCKQVKINDTLIVHTKQHENINDNLSVYEQEVKINNNLIVHTKQHENRNSSYQLKQQQQVNSNDNLSVDEQEVKFNDNLIVHTKQHKNSNSSQQLKQEQYVSYNDNLSCQEQEDKSSDNLLILPKQDNERNDSLQLKQEKQVKISDLDSEIRINDNLSVFPQQETELLIKQKEQQQDTFSTKIILSTQVAYDPNLTNENIQNKCEDSIKIGSSELSTKSAPSDCKVELTQQKNVALNESKSLTKTSGLGLKNLQQTLLQTKNESIISQKSSSSSIINQHGKAATNISQKQEEPSNSSTQQKPGSLSSLSSTKNVNPNKSWIQQGLLSFKRKQTCPNEMISPMNNLLNPSYIEQEPSMSSIFLASRQTKTTIPHSLQSAPTKNPSLQKQNAIKQQIQESRTRDQNEGRSISRIPSMKLSLTPFPRKKKKVNNLYQLWTHKYAPSTLDDCIGNKLAIQKLENWLVNWENVAFQNQRLESNLKDNPFSRACLISGPPGIGKTSTVRLLAKKYSMHIVEWNASDVRNKAAIDNSVHQLIDNQVLCFDFPNSKERTIILMDEVDGMSSGDIGGNQQLLKLIKDTKNPIFCVCNDRYAQKLRSLVGACYDVRFQKPTKTEVAKRLFEVCRRENLRSDLPTLELIADSANTDIRQSLNLLQIQSKRGKHIQYKFLRDHIKSFSKDDSVSMSVFEVIKLLMTRMDFSRMSIKERMDLFSMDYELLPLLMQENYLSAIVSRPWSQSDLDELENIVQASQALAEIDILGNSIRSQGNWCLLQDQGFLTSVYVPERVCTKMSTFPQMSQVLGKMSSQRKTSRLIRELKMNMSMQISGDRKAIQFDYSPHLMQLILCNLEGETKEDIDNVVEIMNNYNITPDILKEHLIVLQYKGDIENRLKDITPSTKGALTKAYNKRFKENVKSLKKKSNLQELIPNSTVNEDDIRETEHICSQEEQPLEETDRPLSKISYSKPQSKNDALKTKDSDNKQKIIESKLRIVNETLQIEESRSTSVINSNNLRYLQKKESQPSNNPSTQQKGIQENKLKFFLTPSSQKK